MMQIRVSFGLICLLSSMTLTSCRGAKTDPEAIKQRIVTAVPLRSTPAQVLAYLSGQKIEHTQYVPGGADGRSITARMRDGKWSIVQTTYIIRFFFDAENHLVDIHIRRVYTGP
jgi:hypothetical protein